LLDIAQELALKLLKASAVNGSTSLAPSDPSLAVEAIAEAAIAAVQPAQAAEPDGFV
jgi:hypothetical protein